MNVYPTKLQLIDEHQLQIEWNDGQRRQYRFRDLRDACPCATCREKRSASKPKPMLPIIGDAELQPLKINGMKPVGSYAYTIAWSDGHDTGIYTYELLRELGELV